MMTVETRDLGLGLSKRTVGLVADIFHTALSQYEEEVRRVRVRLSPAGHSAGVLCKVRAWHAHGPQFALSTMALTLSTSVHEAARTLAQSVRRLKDRSIAVRRVGHA